MPWCVNKEVADINIPSHGFMPQSKLTGTEYGFLGLVHLAKYSTQTLTHLFNLGVFQMPYVQISQPSPKPIAVQNVKEMGIKVNQTTKWV